MQIMISADMEGATGVTCGLDVDPETRGWERFRHLFSAEVNAVATGLFEAGADEVLVNEAHASMRNLPIEELDDRLQLLTGRHKPLGMMEGIADADGVVFLGYHVGASQPGVLAHTYLGNSITGVWLDSEPASEGHLNAHLADEFGVPVILVSGDDRTCEDAAGYAPEARTVAVKRCISRYAAVCLSPAKAFELQREAAADSATLAKRVPASQQPHRVEIEFDATHLADAVTNIPTVESVGHCRVGFDSPSMLEAMQTFKVMSAIAAGAREKVYG